MASIARGRVRCVKKDLQCGALAYSASCIWTLGSSDVAVRDLRQQQDNGLVSHRNDPVGLIMSEMEYLV